MAGTLTRRAGALALVVATAAVAWTGSGWPPPSMILEYGLPGAQRPTGRVAVIDGIEFIELPPGYCFASVAYPIPGTNPLDPLDSIPARLECFRVLPRGSRMESSPGPDRGWIRIPGPSWVSRGRLEDLTARREADTRQHTDSALARMDSLARTTGVPIDICPWDRVDLLLAMEPPPVPVPLGADPPGIGVVFVDRDRVLLDRRLGFALASDEERFVRPYLVEGR